MSRILEKNGINNTNIDGASFNNFCAGQRSGIIKGTLNECAITTPSSSVINIETGELLVSGVRVVLNSPTNFTFSTFPSSATRYSLIAEIVIDSNSDITSRVFVQLANSALVQNDLFKTETGAGTYQIELARFTLTPNGIEDLVRTVDIITGGMGGDGAHWEVGEITTEKLAPDLNAEVDIDYNEDTKKYDFNFALPEANNIVSVLKTSTTGLIDTYTITFINGETKTFDVTNGNGIVSIVKTGTVDNVDTYTITYNDSTTSTFTVSNSPIQTVNGKNDVNIVLKTDDISDTDQTNKFVTDTEKEVWNAKEPPLPARPEVNEESKFLGWDGTGNKVWKEVSGTGGGGGLSTANIYLTEIASTVEGTYKQLSYDLEGTTTVRTKTVNNNTKLLDTYLFDIPIATTRLDSGTWNLNVWCRVSVAGGATRLTTEVFKRALDGTQTILFTTNSVDINNTTYEYVETHSEQPSFDVLETDRIGFNLYIGTTHTSSVVFDYHIGDGKGAYLNIPLALRHIQLRDLNGDTNYLHTTSAEKASWNNKAGKADNNIFTGENIFANDVQIGTAESDADLNIKGTLNINGDIIQNGSSYETHAEQVYTTSDEIILRDGAEVGLAVGEEAGLKFKKYDGTNDGSLKIDKDGIVRVGDVGSEQPLATREETPINAGVARWNNSATKFITETPDTTPTASSTKLITSGGTKAYVDEKAFSRVYKALTELTGITTSSTLAQVCDAMIDNSYLNASTSGYEGLVPTGETDLNGQLEIIKVNPNRVRLAWSYQNASRQPIYFATYRNAGGFLGWKRFLTDSEAQNLYATKLSIGQWNVPYRDIAGNGEPNTSKFASMTSPLPEAILIRDAEGKATFVGGTSANQGIVKSQLDSVIADITALQNGKADKSTTISGYGITNAYTKTEIDSKLNILKDPDKTYLVIKTPADFDEFTLLTGNTGSPNYTIEWGDGSSEDVVGTSNPTHTYSKAGMYLITISGDFANGIVVGSSTNVNKAKMIEVYGGTNYPTSIEAFAFQNCSNLTTATFPNATSIGSEAFRDCSNLTTATFPKVTTIGISVFESCSNLTTANFPNATSIEDFAFFKCSNLTTATFPNATSIGSYAFDSCINLKTLTLGNVETTATGTRFYNVKLDTLTISGTITDTDIVRIKNLIISNGGSFSQSCEIKYGLQVEKTPTLDNDVVNKIYLDSAIQTAIYNSWGGSY